MKSNLLFCLLLMACTDIFCQGSNVGSTSGTPGKIKSPGDAMLALNVGMPFPSMTKAIQNNMGNMGFGLGGLLLVSPVKKKDFPIRLGGEVGYTYYGRFKTNVNVNGYEGDYKTSYGIITLHAVARFRPAATHRVTPFADVFAGGNFYISTIKENLGFIETALGLESFDLGGEFSASFSRGLGAGVTIGDPSKDQGRFVLRVSYIVGSSLKYIVRNSLAYDESNHTLTYHTDRAPVKYMMVQLGIGF